MSNSTKKLSILYHHRTQGRGAEGVHITSIVNALESMGHSVTVVSPAGVDPMKNAGNAPVDKSVVNTSGIESIWKFISKNLPNFLFEFAEIIYNIPAMRNLEKELSKKKYDLIYERYAFYLVAGAIKAKKYKIPFVLEANEVSGIKDRARKQTFKRLCDSFENYLFNNCTSIHTVSSYLKNMIIDQNINGNIIEVTPNAIDPNKFSGHINNEKLVKKYSLKDKITIGFAGWFDEWDRLDLLLEVFSKSCKVHKNLNLMLIGDGEVLTQVRNYVSENKLESKVILTGAVERKDVHTYLSLLDVAVITHSNEFGSPVVMFEFMGLKVPIVAPKLMPITDVLVDGVSALHFDTLNMNDLYNKIDILLRDSDKRRLIAENAFNLLMNKHTWTMNAKEIIRTSGV